MITVTRYHDFSAGHRVYGHESKCALLHGHNYRVHFTCSADTLDAVGRVMDFGVIKETLCQWLEDNWDHRFLLWDRDPLRRILTAEMGVVLLTFNPTAENMAMHLVNEVAPKLLAHSPVFLAECRIDETRKCGATYAAD